MTAETLAEVVAAHPLLAGLPGDVAATVGGCARLVAFGAGRLLLTEGKPADAFYLVRRGSVSIELQSPGRGAVVVEVVPTGGIVGWSWLFPPYRYQFDARALGAVGAIVVEAACLRSKADRDPAFGYALLQRLSGVLVQRLQATRLRLLDLYDEGTLA